MPSEAGERQGGWSSGDVQGYKCPHCGLYFEVELHLAQVTELWESIR
ncbi:MAG: hypothetical protein KKE86_10975 [Planctomycetes bacterium]|nr:hypothetical protein [Planctomycetota bacterium]